jgi:hypothetical protein
MRKRAGRSDRLKALRRESDANLLEMIRQWQRLPPGRRTHFLRKRISFGATAA